MRTLLYHLVFVVRVLRGCSIRVPFDIGRDELLLSAHMLHMSLTTYVIRYEDRQRSDVGKDAHLVDRSDDRIDLTEASLSSSLMSAMTQPTVSPLKGRQTTARYWIVYSATPLPGTTRPSEMRKESSTQMM